MKGRIILTSVDHPKGGMLVVYKNTICKLEMNFDGTGTNRFIDSEGNITLAPFDISPKKSSELKQIVVEYNPYPHSGVSKKGTGPGLRINSSPRTTLPLDPSQWSWALAFIGHELEVKIVTGLEPDQKVPLPEYAQIIIPTPVGTIEDIPEELREIYRSHPYFREKTEYAKKFIEEHGLPEGWFPPVEESWDDIGNKFIKESFESGWPNPLAEHFTDWLKQHYLPPKRK